VFFFTLIDLFLSALFLGFVLFAISLANQASIDDRAAALLKQLAQSEGKTPSEVLSLVAGLSPLDSSTAMRAVVDKAGGIRAIERLADLSKREGLSGLAELSERLTRLGPIQDLELTKSTLERLGGLESVRQKIEALGPIPCRYVFVGGRREVTVLATITVDDEVATIAPINRVVWDSVMVSIGRSAAQNQRVPLQEFQATFGKVRAVRTDCKFSVNLAERTRFSAPRDIVGKIFTFARIFKVNE
jgi:hypothetical protein